MPTLLEGLRDVEELCSASISRVRVPTAWRGRVALLGDAVWGRTLGMARLVRKLLVGSGKAFASGTAALADAWPGERVDT